MLICAQGQAKGQKYLSSVDSWHLQAWERQKGMQRVRDPAEGWNVALPLSADPWFSDQLAVRGMSGSKLCLNIIRPKSTSDRSQDSCTRMWSPITPSTNENGKFLKLISIKNLAPDSYFICQTISVEDLQMDLYPYMCTLSSLIVLHTSDLSYQEEE